jgi:hypothetical protein
MPARWSIRVLFSCRAINGRTGAMGSPDMNHFLDLDFVRDEMLHPFPSGRMSPEELGDTLARLVWEGFSDHVVEERLLKTLSVLGVDLDEGVPDRRAAEELLIFHMWAHSRAAQLSFFRRFPESLVRAALDHLHRAVFDDMIANGTPKAQMPVFEQRVGARYSEYYTASGISDDRVGQVAAEHVCGVPIEVTAPAARLMTERAIEIAHPLRDFLEGVELIDPETTGSAD